MLNAASNCLPRARTSESAFVARASLCLSIIICGLALRGFGFSLGLPPYFVKYGGSLLWGTMVFVIVAIAGSSLSRRSIALISAAIVVCVELFRLGHAPVVGAL